MIEYINILNIQLEHEYFKGGQCRDLQLQADAETIQWMQQCGIQFKQVGSIGQLYVPSTFDLSQAISANPKFELTFNVIFKDQLFLNYTEIPINEIGTFVFSNTADNAFVNGDLRMLGTKFESADTQVHEKAIVALALDQLESDQSKWPLSYFGSFKARALRWKYYIINTTEGQDFQFQLEGEGSDLFSGPASESLADGSSAQVFDSGSNLLPLKEESSIDLKLLAAGDSGQASKVLIEHLPVANPQSLKAAQVGMEQELCAVIYVYV